MTAYNILRAEDLGRIDLNEGIIIDVRTKMEHGEKRLSSGHAHMPLDELNPVDFMMRHGLDKDSGVYILCRSGKRAAQAAEKFVAEGYRNVHVIEGGIIACEECGHDIQGHTVTPLASTQTPSAQKTRKMIPLERQVRIAAGAIAATGALFGLVVHPLFSIIPLAVGGGLVFAGVTDRCGMALILTKAPWNRTEGSCCSVSANSSAPAGAKTGQSCQ